MNTTLLLIAGLLAADAGNQPPPLRIAYFVPADRQPIEGYVERLDRVMTEVQRFYREGMRAAGYGPMTFGLDRDSQGRLRVDLIRGRHPMQVYGRDAAGAIRREVQTALARQGIDVDHQTLVIFQVLLAWEGDRATEIGPYVGGGNHRAGTAWVYDDEHLDPRMLGSKAPGGFYGRPCSLGEFNSHYLGGVAHELGHAFGLPHDCQRTAERATRGLSLMGGGNHTYGEEKRGEGPGTFLSAASAMLLARSRPIAGEQKEVELQPVCRLKDFDASFRDGTLVLTGTVDAKPPAFGIVAYNDWAAVPDDYDAVGWTCRIDNRGRFRLEIGEMRPEASQLRLKVCHANGATSQFAFDYQVDSQGRPNVEAIRHRLPLEEAVAAYAAGNRARTRALAIDLQQRFPQAPEIQGKAAHLLALTEPSPPQPLANLPAKDGWVAVSQAKFRSAVTGWGPPLRDQVPVEKPGDCFLQLNGEFFPSGLFAHAPSKYELELNRECDRFRSEYGLQDGHAGSVVFVVRGDGRELFRSSLIQDHVLRKLDVDVRGKSVLELSVEEGKDGATSDWGVWIRPQMKRTGRDQR
jgi:hypothetical protein